MFVLVIIALLKQCVDGICNYRWSYINNLLINRPHNKRHSQLTCQIIPATRRIYNFSY